MDRHNTDDQNQSNADMSAFEQLCTKFLALVQVQNLLQQMQSRFQAMSDSIVTKVDDMGNRINELEQSISDLKSEMGMEGSPSPIDQSKPNPDEVKKEEGSA